MNAIDLFEYFVETGHVDVARGDVFDRSPPEVRAPADRIAGMLLGVAVGDALGAPTEAQLPGERRSKHGEVRDYLPSRADDRRVGYPTDDTQMTFWTVEHLLAAPQFDPDALAKRFCAEHIYGIGSSVRSFIRRYDDQDEAWFVAGQESAGNGALMRISPMVLPYVDVVDRRAGSERVWAETALSAMLTHNDPAAIASAVGYVDLLLQLLDRPLGDTPDPEWWVERYVATTRDVEVDGSYRGRPGSDYRDFRGPLWEFVDTYVPRAYYRNESVVDACNSWFSGAFLLETVPSVLYILMHHADDPEEAIVRAVTDTKDNDTVAAIVGAAVGALHGRRALPDRWVADLTGRTRSDDPGHVFDVVDAACEEFAAERPRG